jgi:hypothetical protein
MALAVFRIGLRSQRIEEIESALVEAVTELKDDERIWCLRNLFSLLKQHIERCWQGITLAEDPREASRVSGADSRNAENAENALSGPPGVRGAMKAEMQDAPTSVVLSDTEVAVVEILLALPIGRALIGSKLLDRLSERGIDLDHSGLTTRVIPRLKAIGIAKNTRRVGYHIPDNAREYARKLISADTGHIKGIGKAD